MRNSAGSDVGSVEYRAHVENIGWQGMKYNGQMAGTQGQHLRMEAIRMDLYNNPNKDFIVYLPDYGGWQYRSENGRQAGTTGVSEPITALSIDIT